MAEPILLELPPRNIRGELIDRLERAPIEHAEALLESYELLQSLHDAGVLNLLRGMLDSGNQVLEDVVEAANKPGSLRALRNVVILAKLAESLDPEVLKKLAASLPKVADAIYNAHQAKPPTLWQSLKIAGGENVRRGLAAINAALGAVRESVAETKVPQATNGED